MPFKLVKSGKGYKVGKKDSSKTFSKHPMSKAQAKKQLAAIEVNTHGESAHLLARRVNSALTEAEATEPCSDFVGFAPPHDDIDTCCTCGFKKELHQSETPKSAKWRRRGERMAARRGDDIDEGKLAENGKFVVWLRMCDGRGDEDVPDDRWVEQGDGPLTRKTADRIAKEIAGFSGHWCKTRVLPAGMDPNDTYSH